MADMNPTKLPRLEPFHDEDAKDTPILVNAFSTGVRWKVVWE